MDYEPTTGKPFTLFVFKVAVQYPIVDDILRTRLTTLGVEEHRLHLEGGQIEPRHQEWVIYDVGGSRTQRGSVRACLQFRMLTLS